MEDFNEWLLGRFCDEKKRMDRSGVYAYTQRVLAYNSNRIEGSTLTEDQTAELFADRLLFPDGEEPIRARDVEETAGHFLMFNRMLDTLREPLTERLIKAFHRELKSGVYEDRAKGFAIGEYKKRANLIGMHLTTSPGKVPEEMSALLAWYDAQEKDLSVLAGFHARYEQIHPFQDGNGRTGRLILFREALVNGIVPPVIGNENRAEYIAALRDYRKSKSPERLAALLRREQENYARSAAVFMIEE